MTGASSPTIGRILSDFADRRWTTRTGRTYELTPLGAFVAERFGDLRDAMETERRLRDVWRLLPREMEGFTVDLLPTRSSLRGRVVPAARRRVPTTVETVPNPVSRSN